MKRHSWHLENAFEIQKESPYTFYLPPQTSIDKLEKGDLVKLIFKFYSDAPKAPNAERMWVIIKEKNKGKFIGELNNQPFFINDIKVGDIIEFENKHIIQIYDNIDHDNIVEKFRPRCIVSNEVFHEKKKIGHIYREEGSKKMDDDNIDSGWVILSGEENQEYMDNPDNFHFVSLGAVLNIDDTIVNLLDEPAGSEFEWNDNLKIFQTV